MCVCNSAGTAVLLHCNKFHSTLNLLDVKGYNFYSKPA